MQEIQIILRKVSGWTVISENILVSFTDISDVRHADKSDILSFPDLTIDLKELEVYLKGRPIHLTRYEFFTLAYLAEHPGWVFSKEQIYEAVWNDPGEHCGTAVANIVSQLRHKLWPDDPNGGYIQTVLNCGYKFISK